jgi:hypothetical protein
LCFFVFNVFLSSCPSMSDDYCGEVRRPWS